jgi:hypothetical protein
VAGLLGKRLLSRSPFEVRTGGFAREGWVLVEFEFEAVVGTWRRQRGAMSSVSSQRRDSSVLDELRRFREELNSRTSPTHEILDVLSGSEHSSPPRAAQGGWRDLVHSLQEAPPRVIPDAAHVVDRPRLETSGAFGHTTDPGSLWTAPRSSVAPPVLYPTSTQMVLPSSTALPPPSVVVLPSLPVTSAMPIGYPPPPAAAVSMQLPSTSVRVSSLPDPKDRSFASLDPKMPPPPTLTSHVAWAIAQARSEASEAVQWAVVNETRARESEAERDEAFSQLRMTQDELASLKETLGLLQAENETLRGHVQELKEAMLQAAEGMSAEQEAWEEERQGAARTRTKLEARVAALEREVQEGQEQVRMRGEDWEGRLRAVSKEHEARLEAVAREHREASAAAEALHREAMAAARADHEAELAQLRGRLSDSVSSEEMLRERILELRAANEKQDEEIASLHLQLKQQGDALKEETDRAAERLNSVRRSVARETIERGSAQQALVSLRSEVDTLRVRLGRAESSERDAVARMEVAEVTAADVAQRMKGAEAELQFLREQLAHQPVEGVVAELQFLREQLAHQPMEKAVEKPSDLRSPRSTSSCRKLSSSPSRRSLTSQQPAWVPPPGRSQSVRSSSPSRSRKSASPKRRSPTIDASLKRIADMAGRVQPPQTVLVDLSPEKAEASSTVAPPLLGVGVLMLPPGAQAGQLLAQRLSSPNEPLSPLPRARMSLISPRPPKDDQPLSSTFVLSPPSPRSASVPTRAGSVMKRVSQLLNAQKQSSSHLPLSTAVTPEHGTPAIMPGSPGQHMARTLSLPRTLESLRESPSSDRWRVRPPPAQITPKAKKANKKKTKSVRGKKQQR